MWKARWELQKEIFRYHPKLFRSKSSTIFDFCVFIDSGCRICYHGVINAKEGRCRLRDPAFDELLVLGQGLFLPFFVLTSRNGSKLIILPTLDIADAWRRRWMLPGALLVAAM